MYISMYSILYLVLCLYMGVGYFGVSSFLILYMYVGASISLREPPKRMNKVV